nr:NAD(P)/FAD-dependent oxidoreductase [Algiphilus sp.]
MSLHYDVVVLGGGAAGLMCAITAGRRGRRVLVLEGSNRVGKKILMSGGGRCNFTNLDVTPDHFLSANPHFCKSALARYTQWDFIAMVERHRIAYHEKERGQLFCDDSAKQIVRMLLDEADAAGVTIAVSAAIDGVSRSDPGFRIGCRLGTITAEALVVATGGLSIPKMGASGFGYALARDFGHAVRETRAGLVPLTLSGREAERYADLSGVGLAAATAHGGHRFDAGMLFTHRGISGPSILQISSYWEAGTPLLVDLLPGRDAAEWLRAQRDARPDAALSTVLAQVLPKRLALCLCEIAFEARPMRRHDDAALTSIGARLNAWRFMPAGTEGYRTAEVTLGGVDVDAVSSRTMASHHVPGLHFAGEVLDVTGHLGGYNFQWAWASGYAAGLAV